MLKKKFGERRAATALPWLRACLKNMFKIIDFERELQDGSRLSRNSTDFIYKKGEMCKFQIKHVFSGKQITLENVKVRFPNKNE